MENHAVEASTKHLTFELKLKGWILEPSVGHYQCSLLCLRCALVLRLSSMKAPRAGWWAEMLLPRGSIMTCLKIQMGVRKSLADSKVTVHSPGGCQHPRCTFLAVMPTWYRLQVIWSTEWHRCVSNAMIDCFIESGLIDCFTGSGLKSHLAPSELYWVAQTTPCCS